VDRLEKGETDLMATSEFEKGYGIPVKAIVTIEEVAERALRGGLIAEDAINSINGYLKIFGGKRA
jgi:hypothetical protein